MNLSKAELHSMGSAPQTTITVPTGKQLSTMDPSTRAARKVYKYLGVYLFTDPHPALTYELAKCEITSFFAFLNALNLTLSEYVRLVNLQLVPTLQYRLMAHPLEQRVRGKANIDIFMLMHQSGWGVVFRVQAVEAQVEAVARVADKPMD